MVLTQNFSKNWHFLLFHTHNYVCKLGFRNVRLSESFAHIRNESPHWHEFIWFLKTNWPKDIDVINTCQVNLKCKSSARPKACPNSVGRALSDMGLFHFSKSHDLKGWREFVSSFESYCYLKPLKTALDRMAWLWFLRSLEERLCRQ